MEPKSIISRTQVTFTEIPTEIPIPSGTNQICIYPTSDDADVTVRINAAADAVPEFINITKNGLRHGPIPGFMRG